MCCCGCTRPSVRTPVRISPWGQKRSRRRRREARPNPRSKRRQEPPRRRLAPQSREPRVSWSVRFCLCQECRGRKTDRQTGCWWWRKRRRKDPNQTPTPLRAGPRCCAPEHPDRGNAGGGSSGGGRPVWGLCWLLITRTYCTRSRLGSLGLKVLFQKLYQERYLASN